MKIPSDKYIILFDGVCNLCNKTVQFIIKHDKNDCFRFAALQSEMGKHLTHTYQINTNKVDFIVLITPQQNYFIKSSAALRIAKQLPGYKGWSILLILPKFLRNYGYDFIAKNRYRWYGKKEKCMVPTPAIQQKFLEPF